MSYVFFAQFSKNEWMLSSFVVHSIEEEEEEEEYSQWKLHNEKHEKQWKALLVCYLAWTCKFIENQVINSDVSKYLSRSFSFYECDRLYQLCSTHECTLSVI